MQLTPYSELMKLSPDERNKKNAEVRMNKQKQKGILAVAQLDENIAILEDAVTSLCSKDDLDFDAIVDKMDELALAQRRRKEFEGVINQLFPVPA